MRDRIHRSEDGSVVEAAVAIPAAMLVVLLVMQVCLWAQAASLVASAADQGDQAACVLGGTLEDGVSQARLTLAATTGREVTSPSVHAALLPGDTVRVEVSAKAESIIPWIHLPVSAIRTGLRQEFRVSG
jgi:hypothetical protein